MKKDLSALVCNLIKRKWLAHWNKCLGNPENTPRQVLHAYIEEMDITVARLDDEMEWACWVDGGLDDDSK
jgi:hypothetical protein